MTAASGFLCIACATVSAPDGRSFATSRGLSRHITMSHKAQLKKIEVEDGSAEGDSWTPQSARKIFMDRYARKSDGSLAVPLSGLDTKTSTDSSTAPSMGGTSSPDSTSPAHLDTPPTHDHPDMHYSCLACDASGLRPSTSTDPSGIAPRLVGKRYCADCNKKRGIACPCGSGQFVECCPECRKWICERCYKEMFAKELLVVGKRTGLLCGWPCRTPKAGETKENPSGWTKDHSLSTSKPGSDGPTDQSFDLGLGGDDDPFADFDLGLGDFAPAEFTLDQTGPATPARAAQASSDNANMLAICQTDLKQTRLELRQASAFKPEAVEEIIDNLMDLNGELRARIKSNRLVAEALKKEIEESNGLCGFVHEVIQKLANQLSAAGRFKSKKKGR